MVIACLAVVVCMLTIVVGTVDGFLKWLRATAVLRGVWSRDETTTKNNGKIDDDVMLFVVNDNSNMVIITILTMVMGCGGWWE